MRDNRMLAYAQAHATHLIILRNLSESVYMCANGGKTDIRANEN